MFVPGGSDFLVWQHRLLVWSASFTAGSETLRVPDCWSNDLSLFFEVKKKYTLLQKRVG